MKTIKAVLTVVVIQSLLFSAVPRGVAYEPTQVVNLLVAYDEEFTYTANWVYGYSPTYLAHGLISEAYYHFYTTFNIGYNIMAYRSWDSDDSVTDPFAMRDEVITETGFYSGMYIGNYRVDVLIAFTDQDMAGAYGVSKAELGVVLVEETYIDLITCGIGQATDNVLQHELSHLYQVDHFEVEGVDSVMNTYPVYIGGLCNPPWGIWVPTALTTDNWDADSIDIITANRELWGEPGVPGGGACPTLLFWNGKLYLKEVVLNIHGDPDVTLQHTISQLLVPEKNSYVLSLIELDESTSHIDYVKLYIVDVNGVWHELYLKHAIHSELGNVKHLLFHDDDKRVDLTPSQIVNLKFTLSNIDADEIAYFIFEINGYNPKLPD